MICDDIGEGGHHILQINLSDEDGKIISNTQCENAQEIPQYLVLPSSQNEPKHSRLLTLPTLPATSHQGKGTSEPIAYTISISMVSDKYIAKLEEEASRK